MRTSLILRGLALAGLTGLTAIGAGCQSERPSAPPAQSTAALPTMERVALAANRCWFKSGDAAFKPYRLAPELNSFSGRPRILIVHRNSPESRPLAVVQAEGHPAKMQAFGPLLDEQVGPRMTSDIRRWASGNSGCN
ncbi:hypothetical protein [Pararhizobium antarcticum]|uniref:Lipoprotein n=1 Tax=Pararhizobium antarcticum TaxID=1798805 RepID=A0A657LPI2_9HYPH|nr:hypothetical protein [Pararhizobium antarcticum]OJF93373.1 hypothetical protein AX760_05035 [Pararhizobium antarcticum]OJF95991.1 hypothetical protein AX761_16650 [Rhizobium sp. 58]